MNLVEIVGNRIKKHVLALGHSERSWRVLIIDQSTAKLLHHTLPMSEVLSRNIAMVERIEDMREPSTEFSAIYFISATSQNAKRIEKDVSQKMYKSVFVVSISDIEEKEERIFESVKKKVEKQREKTKGKEKEKEAFEFIYKCVIFDFIPLASDVFHMETPYSYYTHKEEYLDDIADKIKGVYRTMQARCTPIPVGKYAKELSDRIDSSGSSKLVIMERGSDVNTPFLHTFLFESLLWDLELAGPGYVVESGHLDRRPAKKDTDPNKDSESESESDDEKRLEITEDHKVWMSVRSKQLVETHKILTELIKEETKTEEKEQKSNIKQLVKAVQELPAHTRTLKEIKIFMSLLEKCVEFFNSPGIKETAELEQGISTGKNFSGHSFKHEVTKALFSVLKTARLTQAEKHRLYILYVLNYGSLQRNEEARLIDRGYLSQKEIEVGEKIKKHLAGRKIKPVSKRTLPIARHVPLIADVLTAIIKKDEHACRKMEIDLPGREEAISGASLRKREFVFRQSVSQSTSHRRVMIVYFIGGASIAEISEVREIAQNTGQTIIVGSTDICSPNGMVLALNNL
ncbi:syntaxin-binding protein 3 [Nematocida ausubeli]|nr:syntaxin-binding protein 3 [Nematocida ausubeli]